jgi:hypothetical protein
MSVPGPVIAQVACGSQPPLLVVHRLMGVHVFPLPEYPGLQAQEAMFAPIGVHCAVEAQPPLLVAHASIPVQCIPLPV